MRLDSTDINCANWNMDVDFVVVAGGDFFVHAATATTARFILGCF